MRGDPDGLRRAAAALRQEADRVRLLSLRVRALGGVRWRSPAADLFRHRVEARARSLEAAAEEASGLARDADALAASLEQGGGP